MLDNKLIENALKLTGKTIEFCNETDIHHEIDFENRTYAETREIFSDEKFCYFLLSPEFIEKYQENCINDFESYTDIVLSELFGRALYLYQLGQKHHLIELLSKIK